MTLELRQPKRKRRSGFQPTSPFPVSVEADTGIPAHFATWRTYSGHFSGDSVQVDCPADMSALYSMGFFGKGSLSRGCPLPARKVQVREMLRARQWVRRAQWAALQDKCTGNASLRDDSEVLETNENKVEKTNEVQVIIEDINNDQDDKSDILILEETKESEMEIIDIISSDEDEVEKQSTFPKENKIKSTRVPDVQMRSDCRPGVLPSNKEQELIVLPDSDSEEEDYLSNLKPRLERSKNNKGEVLLLLMEEAMFLSYGLGCLEVYNLTHEKILSLVELWALCQECDPHFIQRYVTYHYYRSKGWVVKSGLKFGGDFLLYKEGPGLYHASYIVIVEVLSEKEETEKEKKRRKMSWTSLMGLNRLAESSGKEVLFCQVFWPVGVSQDELSSPDVIKKFKVNEILLRRWQPSVARIDQNTVEEVS